MPVLKTSNIGLIRFDNIGCGANIVNLLICVLLVFSTSFSFARAENAVEIIFGDDVSSESREEANRHLVRAINSIESLLGVGVPNYVKIYMSANKQFLRRNGAGNANAENQTNFGVIYIRTNSESYQEPRNRMRILLHELVHIVQFDLVGQKSRNCCVSNNIPVVGPIWLMEGTAQYIMYTAEGNGWLTWARSLNSSDKISLEALETRNGMNKQKIGYDLAAFAVHQLVHKIGRSSIVNFYRQLGNGISWGKAFEQSFGLTPDEFYKVF